MDKLRALRYFAKVVETENFTEAAKAFAIPASSISRRIKDLETSLGISLFMRSTRAVRLTELGKLYYEEVKNILSAIDNADNLVSNQSQSPSGIVRITSTPAFGELKLLPTLNRMRKHYPDIIFDIHFTDDILDLSSHALDIAIRSTNTLPENLVARELFDHSFILVATPEYLENNKPPETLKELEGHPAILYRGPDKVMHWQALKNDRWFEVSTTPAFISNNGQSLLDATLNSEGIALFPAWAASEHIISGSLQEIKLDGVQLSLTRDVSSAMYLLYHPPKFRLQKVRVAIDFLLQDLISRS